MQAISIPTPDHPPPFVPAEATGDTPRPSQPWARWAATMAMVIVALALGWFGRGSATPAPSAAPPDLAGTLGWMFDAALAHEGTAATGEVQAAAVGSVIVEQVQSIDPATGPLLVIATLDGTPTAFEVVVQRRGLDWSVEARRLAPAGDGALSQRGS